MDQSSHHPYTPGDVDKVIESFTTDTAYKERARVFAELDRWTGDNPVLLVVDAASTTTGQSYFNQAKPQVEAFRDQFVTTGNITTLEELAAVGDEFKNCLPGERKHRVATEIASYLADRSEASDLASLQEWAREANPQTYSDDPVGQINGVGLRTFQFLRMLAGIDSVKPDTHVISFIDEVATELPEAPLNTSSDQETLESCQWLADNSSFSLLEIDQIAWWYFADVPAEIREEYSNSSSDGDLRIIIKRVDRDELKAIRWGEIVDGEIANTNPKAEEIFSPFDKFVERTIESSPYSSVPDEVFWLRECRSFGSQVHRERASVRHPAIDRELFYPQGPLVGVLRGLDAPESTYDDIIELDLTDPHLAESTRSDAYTVTLRYELEDSEKPGTVSQKELDDQGLPTAANIIEEVVAATEFEHRIEGINVDAIEIFGYLYSQTVWSLHIDYETAADINWNTYDIENLPTDAYHYLNLGK